MESELVVLTDIMMFAETFPCFFAFVTGEEVQASTVFQDTISLIL
jgi:hypothetical protein